MITSKVVCFRVTSAIVIGAAVTSVLGPAGAQELPQQPAGPQASAEHQLLHKDVGTWDTEMTVFSPEDGTPPMQSKGVEKNELLPGGMWLISRYEGEVVGMPFTGMGTTGYDPIEKKYVGTWVDTMSPHMMVIKGEYDAATKTMTSTGEGRDVATREMYSAKLVSRLVDDNHRTFEMHMTGPDGKQFKVMEIKYTRRDK